MAEPNIGEWPFLILHEGHPAWYQRALLRGDFGPGRKPIPNYVLLLNDEIPEVKKDLVCGTCGKKPKVEDLLPVDRMTGADHFLIECRNGRQDWPKPTDPDTCWYCNCAFGNVDPEDLDVGDIGKVHKKETKSKEKVKVCKHCKNYVAKVLKE